MGCKHLFMYTSFKPFTQSTHAPLCLSTHQAQELESASAATKVPLQPPKATTKQPVPAPTAAETMLLNIAMTDEVVRVIKQNDQDTASRFIKSAMSLGSKLGEGVSEELLRRRFITLNKNVITHMSRLDHDFVDMAYAQISSLIETSKIFEVVQSSVNQSFLDRKILGHRVLVAVVLMLGANAAELTATYPAASALSLARNGAAAAQTSLLVPAATGESTNRSHAPDSELSADSLQASDSLPLPLDLYGPKTKRAFTALLQALKTQYSTTGLEVIQELQYLPGMSDINFGQCINTILGDMVEFNKSFSHVIVSNATREFEKALVSCVKRQVEAMGSKWPALMQELERSTTLAGKAYLKLNGERAVAVVLVLTACAKVIPRFPQYLE
jgi:hypothetical protein